MYFERPVWTIVHTIQAPDSLIVSLGYNAIAIETHLKSFQLGMAFKPLKYILNKKPSIVSATYDHALVTALVNWNASATGCNHSGIQKWGGGG
jgi:hypothetical protein